MTVGITVAFEGLPGVGKTAVIRILQEKLTKYDLHSETVDIERSASASEIRLAKRRPLGHPLRMAAFWALRVQQHEMVAELSQFTDIVFADRSWGTALAMDVFGNRVPREFLDWISRHIKHQPDITFFLDAPLSVIRQRKRAETMTDAAFAARVFRGYKKLARELSWIRIDARKSAWENAEECLEIILQKVKEAA